MPSGAAPSEENKAVGADADVDVSFKQQAKISADEMIGEGKHFISELEDILKRIVQLQEIAKKQADVIKLNCVNDKLLQIKEIVNIGEGAMTNIHEAVARNDEDERYHQFSRLTISHQKGQAVGQDAENCIGEDLTFVGETDVSVEVNPNVPGTDPLEPVGGEPIIIERPPLASPVN